MAETETEAAAATEAAADPATEADSEADSETKSVVRRGSTRAHFWTRNNPANHAMERELRQTLRAVVMVLSLEGA